LFNLFKNTIFLLKEIIKMNPTQMKQLLKNTFLHYNERELALDIEDLSKKIANHRCSAQQKMRASQQLGEVYEMLQLFEAFKNLGLDTSGETGASLLEKMSGRTVGELQSSIGTTAVLGMKEGAVKAAVVTKQTTHKFASWLAKVTK
jgi:hypothetical protein